MKKLGFIGTGNIGSAIIGGVVKKGQITTPIGIRRKPAIARLESMKATPKIGTLFKVLCTPSDIQLRSFRLQILIGNL